jgi:hypothetical protein
MPRRYFVLRLGDEVLYGNKSRAMPAKEKATSKRIVSNGLANRGIESA